MYQIKKIKKKTLRGNPVAWIGERVNQKSSLLKFVVTKIRRIANDACIVFVHLKSISPLLFFAINSAKFVFVKINGLLYTSTIFMIKVICLAIRFQRVEHNY